MVSGLGLVLTLATFLQDEQKLEIQKHGLTAIASSSDGKTVAVGGADGNVTILSGDPPKKTSSFQAHRQVISAITIVGQNLVTASDDGSIKVWNLETRELVRTLRKDVEPVSAMSFAPDGKLVAIASTEKTVRLLDASSGEERLELKGSKHLVFACSISPDGKLVAAGSADGMIRLWSLPEGNEKYSWQAHSAPVTTVVWSSDGAALLTCSEDTKAVLWDPVKQAKLLTLEGHAKAVTGAQFVQKRIVTVSDDATVRTWHYTDGKQLNVVSADKPVKGIALLEKGRVVCSVMDGSVHILEIKQK